MSDLCHVTEKHAVRGLRGSLVLVMEDEPLILMDIVRTLKGAGAYVLRARTIRKAHALLAERKIDVAIIDVNMGHNSTCLSVAEDLRTRRIPFCLYSGDLNEAGEFISRLRAPLIRKPASKRAIVDAVARLFQR